MAKEYIEREDALALETFLQDADGFEHSCVLSVDIRSCPAADVIKAPPGWIFSTDFDGENYLVHLSFPISEKQFKALGQGVDL